MKRAAKRHFLVRGASEHRTSRSCPRCQQNDLAPTTKDGKQKPNNKTLDYRSCTSCCSAVTAGDERSYESSKMVMKEDQMVCINIRRGEIAEMQFERMPHPLQNQEYSL